MKILLTILMVIMTITLNAQTQQTLVKTISVDNTHTAFTLLNGNVDLVEWDEDYIRVETTVQLDSMGEPILNRLVLVGRYSLNLKYDKTGDYMVIEMPKSVQRVFVRGKEIKEQYKFKIMVPRSYRVVIKRAPNQDSLPVNDNRMLM